MQIIDLNEWMWGLVGATEFKKTFKFFTWDHTERHTFNNWPNWAESCPILTNKQTNKKATLVL